jgi:hypothetical protein
MGAVTSPAALRPSAAAASFLANYFWLASLCFGFIGTLRFSVCKEVTSCPACAQAGDAPFYRDPGTAFRRYITTVIVSNDVLGQHRDGRERPSGWSGSWELG